jgi:hypothetical protein
LTTSLISIVSQSNGTFMGDQKNENGIGKIVNGFGYKAIEFCDF